MNKQLNLNTWKKDSRRMRELMETANALNGFKGVTVLEDAIDCIDEAEALMELWMNELRANRAQLKYQVDAIKRDELVTR